MTNLADAPGWYPDPNDPQVERWFDGTRWSTEYMRPSPTAQMQALPFGHAHPQLPAQQGGTPVLAIAALVLAIVSPLIGFFLGFAALSKSKTTGQGKGLAVGAIIVSVVWGLVCMLLLIAVVAIPSFLAQKNNAEQAKAAGNTKMLVRTIETCAISSATGSYRGCTSAEAIGALEPGLGVILARGCDSPHGACIEPLDGGDGFEVRYSFPYRDTQLITLTERHDGDGTLTRSCSGDAPPLCKGGAWA